MSQAVTKEAYKAGLNCRGFCDLCSEKNECYQFKALHLTSSETIKYCEDTASLKEIIKNGS